ncbi:MAG TPA: hypothetical protein VJX67_06400 [Blastocatellia bacterium]|nr:hypothetical protein [Blastocatellia bacterium]
MPHESKNGEGVCPVCGGTGLVRCQDDQMLRPEPEVCGFCSECQSGQEKWDATLKAAARADEPIERAARRPYL